MCGNRLCVMLREFKVQERSLPGRIKQVFFEEVNIKTGPIPAIIKCSPRAFFFLNFFHMENFKHKQK